MKLLAFPSALLLCLTLAACKHSTSSTTSANAPITPQTVTLSAAPLDLAQIKNATSIEALYQFTAAPATAPVILGQIADPAHTAVAPVIVRQVGKQWKIVELTTLKNQGWVYAGQSDERNELWGLLDNAVEDRGENIYLVRSSDGGDTWTVLSAVKKPTYQAHFTNFSLAASGRGRLTVFVEDDSAGVSAGLYHYATTDGGKTWTGPTFEDDNISDADKPAAPTVPEAIKALEKSSLQTTP